MRILAFAALVAGARAHAQYPPDYIDLNGGNTASQGRLMQALMGFMKPPVEVDATGGSGPFPAHSYEDRTLPRHVIYAPRQITNQSTANGTAPLPLVVFGNGGCLGLGQTHGTLLTEIASLGYIVIANGIAGNTDIVFSRNTDMFDAIDWATQQARAGTLAVDMTRVTAAGQSCGGMQAYTTSQDARVRTSVIFNSGLMGRASGLRAQLGQRVQRPVVYFLGGRTDVAYSNGMADYEALNSTPVVLLSSNLSHGGGLSEKHGGISGAAAVQWLDWQLKGNETCRERFLASTPLPGYNEQRFKNW